MHRQGEVVRMRERSTVGLCLAQRIRRRRVVVAAIAIASAGTTAVIASTGAAPAIASTSAAQSIASAGAAPPAAAAPGSLQVFVSYADTLRAMPGNFPTPWNGSPGVTFRGCSDSQCVFDASAVRIVNTSRIVQRIKTVTVKIGSCRLNLWPGTTVLRPGQQVILTQTAEKPVEGCSPQSGSIDGSEIGRVQCGKAGGPPPEVDITSNGSTARLSDDGRVLSADGSDPGCAGMNESTQWTAIGSKPCGPATLAIAPPTQSHRVRQRASVLATLTNGCGAGLEGARIEFDATKGPNAKRKWTATTNSSGVASISYSSTRTGTDGISALARNPAGAIRSMSSAQVRWTPPVTYAARAYGAWISVHGRRAMTFGATPTVTRSSATRNVRRVSRPDRLTLRMLRLRARAQVLSSRSVSHASVSATTLAVPGGPTVRVAGVTSSSSTTCSVSSGRTSIRSLTVGGRRITTTRLIPNKVIRLGKRGTITLDEQRRVGGASRGLVVNAIDIRLPGVANVIIASALSDVRYC